MGNKYRAQRTNGFSSKLEAAVYAMLESRANVTNIKCQTKVYLTDAKILYIVDFSYEDASSGALVFVEAKGMETPTWRLKRRLWQHYGPGKLEIWKGSHARPYLAETIG